MKCLQKLFAISCTFVISACMDYKTFCFIFTEAYKRRRLAIFVLRLNDCVLNSDNYGSYYVMMMMAWTVGCTSMKLWMKNCLDCKFRASYLDVLHVLHEMILMKSLDRLMNNHQHAPYITK